MEVCDGGPKFQGRRKSETGNYRLISVLSIVAQVEAKG